MTILTTSQSKLVKQVASDLDRHEGFREFAYPDPLSALYKKYKHLAKDFGYKPIREIIPVGDDLSKGAPWTYGFGFTGSGIGPDSRIGRLQGERKLEELIIQQDSLLNKTLSWYAATSAVTKTVLINMAFNLGLKGLLGFKNTLNYIKEQKFIQAAAGMRKSLWFKQTGRRAQELSNRMETQTIEPRFAATELK